MQSDKSLIDSQQDSQQCLILCRCELIADLPSMKMNHVTHQKLFLAVFKNL